MLTRVDPSAQPEPEDSHASRRLPEGRCAPAGVVAREEKEQPFADKNRYAILEDDQKLEERAGFDVRVGVAACEDVVPPPEPEPSAICTSRRASERFTRSAGVERFTASFSRVGCVCVDPNCQSVADPGSPEGAKVPVPFNIQATESEES